MLTILHYSLTNSHDQESRVCRYDIVTPCASTSLLPDVELLSICVKVLVACPDQQFSISFTHSGLLNAILRAHPISRKCVCVFVFVCVCVCVCVCV